MKPFNNKRGRVNDIYVYQTEDRVYLQFYGFDTDVAKKMGPKGDLSTSLDSFFLNKQIINSKEMVMYKEKFFEFYDPELQKYKRDPLSKEVIEAFMEASFELKKDFKLLSEDLKKMNMPEDELKELLKLSKE